jgi:hypothetical protein
MKNNNPINEILKAAGRRCDFTNRSFYTKAVNAALKTGLVRVEVSNEGKSWVNNATGKQYNLRVYAGGYVRKSNIRSSYIAPSDILPVMGALLLDEDVKKVINADVHLRSESCQKCNGLGIIPQFHYYCSGICFDCGGTGYNFSNEKTTVTIK